MKIKLIVKNDPKSVTRFNPGDIITGAAKSAFNDGTPYMVTDEDSIVCLATGVLYAEIEGPDDDFTPADIEIEN